MKATSNTIFVQCNIFNVRLERLDRQGKSEIDTT